MLRFFNKKSDGINRLNVDSVAKLSLGTGFCANSINTVIFRGSAIVYRERFIFTAFYVDDTTIKVVKVCKDLGLVDFYELKGNYNLNDAHNSISIGIDRDGIIHLAYDCHASQLFYRRGKDKLGITEWTDIIPMTKFKENKATYPTFIQPTKTNPLLFLYRDGGARNGSALLKKYDEKYETWTDNLHPVVSGMKQQPWTSNPYWNTPVRDKKNLHLAFCWRTHSLGKDSDIVNNINICYCKSDDNGLSWYSSNHHLLKNPITPVNCETVYAISPGSNLINQSGMCLDSTGNPHIVFYANVSLGIPQIQHLYFDGRSWHQSTVSDFKTAFELKGSGTLKIPISRPDLFVDKNKNVFVVYRYKNEMLCSLMACVDGKYKHIQTRKIFEDVGYSEPIICKEQFIKSGLVYFYVQKTMQTDGDVPVMDAQSGVYLCSINLSATEHRDI